MSRSYEEPATAIALTGASQVIHAGDCIYMGIAVMDEASGQVKIQIYDGLDDTGKHIGQININSSGNDQTWFGPNGIKCDTGLYVKVYAGTPTGSAFIR